MTITTTQKVIKIGTSRGVTIPAKDLKALGVEAGDDLEIIVRKKSRVADDTQVVEVANSILERYKQDFRNLADR